MISLAVNSICGDCNFLSGFGAVFSGGCPEVLLGTEMLDGPMFEPQWWQQWARLHVLAPVPVGLGRPGPSGNLLRCQ